MDVSGYRKLGMALLVLAIGVAIVLIKGDVSASLVALLTTVFATYTTGNVAAKVVSAKITPVGVAKDSIDYSPALDEIKQQASAIRNAVAVTQQGLVQSLQHTSTIITRAGFDKE